MHLLTEQQLAERFQVDVEELHRLRKRHRWPHVRLGRYDYRFTEEQVVEIVAMHTHAPGSGPGGVDRASSGQTSRSAARNR